MHTDKPALTVVFILGMAYSVFHLRRQSEHGNAVCVPRSIRKKEPYLNLRLPLELCEHIMDFLWDDLDALGACALTCPAFAIRSDYLMDGISRANCLTSEKALNALFSDLLASKEYSRYFDVLKIRTEECTSWVTTAPLRLASKLPRLEQLELIGVFDPKRSHHNSIQHFSCFRSVTTLRLAECAFSKFVDFARLVMALRNLTTLDILDVEWGEYQIQPNLLGPSRAKKLHFTDLYIDVSIGRHGYVPQLLNWFMTTPVTQTITTLSVEIRFARDYEFLTKFLRTSGDTLRRLKVHTQPGIMREAPLSGEYMRPPGRLFCLSESDFLKITCRYMPLPLSRALFSMA